MAQGRGRGSLSGGAQLDQLLWKESPGLLATAQGEKGQGGRSLHTSS